MAHFSESRSSLADLARPRHLALLAVLATAVLPSTADARMGGYRTGGYDGVWNVTFATTRGNCRSGYSVPFTVTGGRVSSAGGGRVSGRVNRSGTVAVQVSVGASHASGGGRLVGLVGAGSWKGIISGDRCSGTWQATRT
ncbi:hypothetical protein [Bradyrhizobium sp. AS23.2]|uniref:hypothetical protein n=1 Tax=Bradyrhizobium sp. AS23.2 TaxID=1680155 RepID=UPI00093BCDF3|nr:hypothetical protein [Bradyrhizobium sp. AS23.2]OKO76603.1 hypothetical protein AC630_22535 [Bradyrhizobium sp. AS23.2]